MLSNAKPYWDFTEAQLPRRTPIAFRCCKIAVMLLYPACACLRVERKSNLYFESVLTCGGQVSRLMSSRLTYLSSTCYSGRCCVPSRLQLERKLRRRKLQRRCSHQSSWANRLRLVTQYVCLKNGFSCASASKYPCASMDASRTSSRPRQCAPLN